MAHILFEKKFLLGEDAPSLEQLQLLLHWNKTFAFRTLLRVEINESQKGRNPDYRAGRREWSTLVGSHSMCEDARYFV